MLHQIRAMGDESCRGKVAEHFSGEGSFLEGRLASQLAWEKVVLAACAVSGPDRTTGVHTEMCAVQASLAGREGLRRKIMITRWHPVQTGYKRDIIRSLENQTMLGPSNGGMEGDWMKAIQIPNHKLLLATVGVPWGDLLGSREGKGWSEGGEVRSRDTS